jgi:recombination protein RecA
MAKTKTKSESTSKDNLINDLATLVNKTAGEKVSYFLDVDRDNPANIVDWIHTGSDMLDLAISNRPNGGMPVGRLVEISGLEGAGKSLMAAHLLKSTQDKGGLAIYIDTENAASDEFLNAIGVNLKEMLYIQLETVEDIFEQTEALINKIRESSSDRLVTIVIDSIMGASTKTEMAADYDKDGYATQKALVLSKAMRKITNLIGKEKILLVTTNQLRIKMNAPAFADPYTTSGGKAIGFHSSVRLRLSSIKKIKAKDTGGVEQIVGVQTKCVVSKNRLGPPHKTITYDIYFDSGIDNYGGWLNILKDYKIVKQSGAWYKYVCEATGEEISFQSKDFVEKCIEDTDVKNELYQKICDNYIMKYIPNESGGIDDIILEDNNVLDVEHSEDA